MTLRERLKENLEAFAKPGLACGAVTPSANVVYLTGSSGNETPLHDRSLFDIGSITKTFTALILASLVESGELTLDATVRELTSVESAPTLTLRALATHTSGLPRLPPNLDGEELDPLDPYAHYSEDMLADALRLHVPPGSADVEYSNFGFMTLGFALTRAAGRSYEELLQEHVCGPLHLAATTVSPDPARQVAGHEDGVRVPDWRKQVYGAGGIWSDARDMVEYLRAQLHPDDTSIAWAIKATHEPRARMNKRISHGLAWVIQDDGITWHNGGTGGFGSFLGFIPDRSVGLFALSNSAPDVELDRAVVRLVREIASQPAG